MHAILAKSSIAMATAMAGLFGCAYKIPIKDNEPTATVRFVDPRNAAGGRLLSQVPTKISLLDETGCAELGHVAGIGAFNNYRMDLTIPAGRKLVFQWFSTAPGYQGMWHCKVISGFSAEAGQLYEARFDMNLDRKACTVDLVKISQAGGRPAAEVRIPMSPVSSEGCKGGPS